MIHFELLLPEGGTPGALWTAVDVLRELDALARVRAPRTSKVATGWRLIDANGRSVKRAQMWLEGTFRSVDEIAHDCGYGDTSAFCRMFARATGTSPQRYCARCTFRGSRARRKQQVPPAATA